MRSSLLRLLAAGLAVAALAGPAGAAPPRSTATAATPTVSVGAQFDTTHVYVAPADFDRFVASLLATFGGKATPKGEFTVTPTPSTTLSQLVLTPVGSLSVFGFTLPAPAPFGAERTGYLVTDLDAAVTAAEALGADVLVAPFPDPIGRDAIIQWPGGVNMQLYWHTAAPHYEALRTVPENRVYVTPRRADVFVRDFVAFAHGRVVDDTITAPGAEVGRPGGIYRRIRVESGFGKLTVLASQDPLPWPYGREVTGYEVANLADTLAKATAAGVTVLVPAHEIDGGRAAMVQFPGGYIAEIHAPEGR
jgi:predicted enzyme related to lactoylglutathione lyase